MGSIRINGVCFNTAPVKAFKTKEEFLASKAYAGRYPAESLDQLWQIVHPNKPKKERVPVSDEQKEGGE